MDGENENENIQGQEEEFVHQETKTSLKRMLILLKEERRSKPKEESQTTISNRRKFRRF
jgi:hypothetical protein